MGQLLYLVHRLPYPPNKGDKVRSYHLLQHLVQQHRVFLGTFIDDPADEEHLETVRQICPDLHVVRLNPRIAKLRSLAGFLTHHALSIHYYKNSSLQAWVNQTLADNNIDTVVIFSSVMAQFVSNLACPPMLVDFVDVDSAKWTQYAPDHHWPLSWLYRRESDRLLAFERAIALLAVRSFFVTENEAEIFRNMAPESAHRVEAISNGVDSDFFSLDVHRPSPFTTSVAASASIPVVFTGAMDYWPNIDAVMWFATDILPALHRQWPSVCFYIVGRNPPSSVTALASPGKVVVTGTVADVRPYLQHAAVVVAPLRVARGIQNKILDAMAMERPVVASQSCVQAINAKPETELLAATSAADFVNQISALLQSPQRCASVGKAGRQRVLYSYSWAAHLTKIDPYLNCKANP